MKTGSTDDFTIPPALLAAIQAVADDENRPVADVVRDVVERGLEERRRADILGLFYAKVRKATRPLLTGQASSLAPLAKRPFLKPCHAIQSEHRFPNTVDEHVFRHFSRGIEPTSSRSQFQGFWNSTPF